jgi:hypothetical protein
MCLRPYLVFCDTGVTDAIKSPNCVRDLCFGLFLMQPAVEQAEVHAQQRGGEGGGRQIEVWAPRPTKANPFIPPNKPLTKIAALLAKHKGEQTWTETVVSDSLFPSKRVSRTFLRRMLYSPDCSCWSARLY